MIPTPQIRRFGLYDYQTCAEAMRQWSEMRATADRADEIWLLQHPSILTLGASGDPVHIRPDAELPVVRTSRGGQATCHAPGQLVVYTLLNLRRLRLGVRALVATLEGALLALLEQAGLPGHRKDGWPGIYVDGRKIASIGLRVSRARSSHGLALNVHPNLDLFRQIDICGDPALRATSLREYGIRWSVEETAERLLPALLMALYPDEAHP